MTTAQILKGLTDRALFEKIANSVLRHKYPSLGNLIESGINEKGETIKDPADAFCQIDEDHYAFIAHTTDDTNLERKWLYESQKTTKSMGDLVKAIAVARRMKLDNPRLLFIIYLVTNQQVSSELFEKVKQKCNERYINVEILELSNIASFFGF